MKTEVLFPAACPILLIASTCICIRRCPPGHHSHRRRREEAEGFYLLVLMESTTRQTPHVCVDLHMSPPIELPSVRAQCHRYERNPAALFFLCRSSTVVWAGQQHGLRRRRQHSASTPSGRGFFGQLVRSTAQQRVTHAGEASNYTAKC